MILCTSHRKSRKKRRQLMNMRSNNKFSVWCLVHVRIISNNRSQWRAKAKCCRRQMEIENMTRAANEWIREHRRMMRVVWVVGSSLINAGCDGILTYIFLGRHLPTGLIQFLLHAQAQVRFVLLHTIVHNTDTHCERSNTITRETRQ